MKRIVLLFSLFSSLLFISSCSNNDHHHEGTSTDGTVLLDNGNQWEANIETTRGIQGLKQLITAFETQENIDAYRELSTTLETVFISIFSQCTMKGEAHNQLHNYLIPIQGYIQSLGESDLDKCKSDVEQLDKHLDTYSKYFK